MNDDNIMVRVAADLIPILDLLHERLGIYYWDATSIYLMDYKHFLKAFDGYGIEYDNEYGTANVKIGDITFRSYIASGVGDDV